VGAYLKLRGLRLRESDASEKAWPVNGRPRAKAPPLSYRSFVRLKPHANPKDQGIDFFNIL
jgi:hypothetical protein